MALYVSGNRMSWCGCPVLGASNEALAWPQSLRAVSQPPDDFSLFYLLQGKLLTRLNQWETFIFERLDQQRKSLPFPSALLPPPSFVVLVKCPSNQIRGWKRDPYQPLPSKSSNPSLGSLPAQTPPEAREVIFHFIEQSRVTLCHLRPVPHPVTRVLETTLVPFAANSCLKC